MHLGCPYTGSAADTPGCYNAAVRTHLCHDTLLVYVPIARSMAKKMIHKIKPAILGFCLIGLAACNSEPDIQISNNAVTTELPRRSDRLHDSAQFRLRWLSPSMALKRDSNRYQMILPKLFEFQSMYQLIRTTISQSGGWQLQRVNAFYWQIFRQLPNPILRH